MTEQEYRDDPALNFHTLERFHRDPKVFKENPIEDVETDAMRFGTAFHAKLLTPDEYEKNVAVFHPPINPKTCEPYGVTTKAYKEVQEAFLNRYDFVISDVEEKTIDRMLQEYYLHPVAPKILAHIKETEKVVKNTFETPLGDVDVKGRIDAITAEGIVDIKTTANFDDGTGRDRFKYAIYDYKYIVQLAFYRRLLDSDDKCWIIAFEKNSPNRVAVYSIADEVIEKANGVIDAWLYQWKLAEQGTYKSKYDDLIVIDQYDPLRDM